MGATATRFVAKAIAGQGWRIWDRTQKKWWGNLFADYPSALLAELNGPKRPEQISKLSRGITKPKR